MTYRIYTCCHLLPLDILDSLRAAYVTSQTVSAIALCYGATMNTTYSLACCRTSSVDKMS